MSDLVVTGGAGGLEVAVEELHGTASAMRRSADVVEGHTPAETHVAVPVPPPPVGPPDLQMLSRAVGAPPDLMSLVVRTRHEMQEAAEGSRLLVARMRELADTLSSAARSYAWAEEAAARAVAGLHAQAMAFAWLVTEATGRAFGLLDEGSGWDVRLDAAAPTGEVSMPTSTASLLEGVESLGSQGRVRVIEVPSTDGATTWVLQVPGTHGGWAEGGEVPMDWPANVSLMLRATSASKVAAAQALRAAQGGRARPGDRVVIAGHSQGGIVAAALASDPEFARSSRVSHVVTAGSPIDAFPIPDSTSVLSLQHGNDAVPMLDTAPPPERRNWTTVMAAAPAGVGAHALSGYGRTATRAQRSDDVALRQWRTGLDPILRPAPGSTPVVHEYRSTRRWQNREP